MSQQCDNNDIIRKLQTSPYNALPLLCTHFQVAVNFDFFHNMGDGFEFSTIELCQVPSCGRNKGGSAFSKGPGSDFSKDPGPGPGPVYKVCHIKVHNAPARSTEPARLHYVFSYIVL